MSNGSRPVAWAVENPRLGEGSPEETCIKCEYI